MVAQKETGPGKRRLATGVRVGAPPSTSSGSFERFTMTTSFDRLTMTTSFDRLTMTASFDELAMSA